jgi:hypothetical protein
MDEYEDIKNYENLYKINKGGSIWSCHYRKPMKIQTNDDGYLYVNLTKDRIPTKGFISRLLAKQWIPNTDETKTQVDHIDKNILNNNLENLRWVTQAENLANKNRKGCIYQDFRKNGTVYWKGSYSYYENGKRIVKQKTSRDKEVIELWLEELKKQTNKEL